jgi:hypothetical protein
MVLYFGDEQAQTIRGLTEEDVALALNDAGLIFYGFVVYTNQYVQIAAATNGEVYPLTSTNISRKVNLSLRPICN